LTYQTSASNNNNLKFTYIMSIEQIKSEINALALDMNVSFVAACQAMQSAAAIKGDEKMITVIHKIKMESING